MKAMDSLKAALAERQAKAQKLVAETGTKWVRRSELEEKRKEEYFENQRLEEEKQRLDDEDRFEKLEEHLSKAKQKDADKSATKDIPAHILDEALLGDDNSEPPVAIGEVQERLREIAQPITLFGETDMQRYKRLLANQKEISEGKKNPDIVMLEGVAMSQQQLALQNEENDQAAEDDDADDAEEGSDKEDSDAEAPGPRGDEALQMDEVPAGTLRRPGGDVEPDKSDSDSEDAGEQAVKAGRGDMDDKSDSDAEDPAAALAAAGVSEVAAAAAPEGTALPQIDVDLKLMDKCDAIRQWCRKSLKAWEKELADKSDEVKKMALTKTEMAQHRQVRRDVRPLQRRLRAYVLQEFLLEKIHHIVDHAANRRYRDANEAYLDLSIGKAAWPVGIGCGGSMLMEDAIGLHDRFNRMKSVNDVAFALNDDVTRKFVQALKRLMNVAQRYWPPEDGANLG